MFSEKCGNEWPLEIANFPNGELFIKNNQLLKKHWV